jgi:hypothetical protein
MASKKQFWCLHFWCFTATSCVLCYILAGKLIASRRGSVYFVENSFARQTFVSSKIDNLVCTGRTSEKE